MAASPRVRVTIRSAHSRGAAAVSEMSLDELVDAELRALESPAKIRRMEAAVLKTGRHVIKGPWGTSTIVLVKGSRANPRVHEDIGKVRGDPKVERAITEYRRRYAEWMKTGAGNRGERAPSAHDVNVAVEDAIQKKYFGNYPRANPMRPTRPSAKLTRPLFSETLDYEYKKAAGDEGTLPVGTRVRVRADQPDAGPWTYFYAFQNQRWVEFRTKHLIYTDAPPKSRANPSLIVLSNPAGGRPPPPPKVWGRFHLTDASRARMTWVPDVPGVPKTVSALGLLERIDMAGANGKHAVEFRATQEDGPWLVQDVAGRRLWIVARRPIMALDTWEGMRSTGIGYFPPSNSGKHDARRGFFHEWGEGGRYAKAQWSAKCWPKLMSVDEGGRAWRLAGGCYHVEPRGIVS